MRMLGAKYFCTSLIISLLFYNNENVLEFTDKNKCFETLETPVFVQNNLIQKKKSILFPLQKSFSVMKSGDSVAKFIFDIDRKRIFKIKGINFNKVCLRFPLKYLDKEFLIGSKGETIFTAFDVNDILGVNSFFSFKERKNRKIGFIIPYPNSYLVFLDNIYKQNEEYVYKIDYDFYDPGLKPEESTEKNNYIYLPEWEIKEMYYTKNRGLIKVVIKNNKNNLTYTALPD